MYQSAINSLVYQFYVHNYVHPSSLVPIIASNRSPVLGLYISARASNLLCEEVICVTIHFHLVAVASLNSRKKIYV